MKQSVLFISIFFLFVAGSASAKHLMTVDKAMSKMFKKHTRYDIKRQTLTSEQIAQLEEDADITFKGTHAHDIVIYTVYQDNAVMGYAFEDTVFGKWGPIHFLMGVNLDGSVKEIRILDFEEIRGKGASKRRFLKQYKKKTIHDPIRIRRDIDGISGATVTSRSMTDGVRKLVHVFNSLIK